MRREEILAWAKKIYGTEPEYLWKRFPGYAVLRRSDNRKWYGILMNVPKNRLGLEGNAYVDVLNLKADPLMAGSLLMQEGIFPGYHMQKGTWITLLLDGTVPKEELLSLLQESYALTGRRNRPPRRPVCGTEWIVPANPRYYDVEAAVTGKKGHRFRWKQSSSVAVGDTVYLYVTAPFSAIRYQCRAVEVDIPCRRDTEHIHMERAMVLQLLQCYDKTPVDLNFLRSYGVDTVRGPRRMPHSLACALRKLYPAEPAEKNKDVTK